MGTEKGRSKETRLLRGVGKAILACQDAGRASKTRVCGYTFVPLCVSGCVCMPVSVSCVSIYVFVCTHIRVRVSVYMRLYVCGCLCPFRSVPSVFWEQAWKLGLGTRQGGGGGRIGKQVLWCMQWERPTGRKRAIWVGLGNKMARSQGGCREIWEAV